METINRIPFTATEQGETAIVDTSTLFETLRPKLDSLKSDWDKEIIETEKRRKIRKIDVDVESLRAQGKLKPDETLIGVRVIDENIKKEQPVFVNYLTQSDRLAVFDCKTTPSLQTKPLEIAFAKGMNYDGFFKQFFKGIDGAGAHGWDAVEVTFDESKPLDCGVEHIGHENLLFSWEAKDPQADEVVMRRFKVTSSQLKSWVIKHGFNSVEVDNLLQKDDQDKIPDPIEIFKVWIKSPAKGYVEVAWCALEGKKCTNWLKDPTPLFLGRTRTENKTVIENVVDPITGASLPMAREVPQEVNETETMFPIFIQIYLEGEEQCITQQKGRVFYDRPWQDAQIALRSLVINGAIRASNVYGSPRNPSATGAKISRLDITLEHGCFYSEPMDFWRTEYPDPAILQAADSLDTRKAAETGQTASAVINRKDSRKTATELDAAKEDTAKLTLTPIMLFSGFMRSVLTFCWYIVQARARQNKIILLPKSQIDPTTGMTLGVINDPLYIEQEYDVKPAGDPDVIRREDRIQREVNMIPIMQGTPAWIEFLKDLIMDVLPENGQKYVDIINAAEQNKDQMIIALAGMLKEVVVDDTGNIKPEFQKHAPMLQQVFSQLPQTTTNGESNVNEQPAAVNQ